MTAASGLDTVEAADLRAMLARGSVVGFSGDQASLDADRYDFQARWDGRVFRLAAGPDRMVCVATSWPVIVATMDAEAAALAGLDGVENDSLRGMLREGWPVRFVAAEQLEGGPEVATVRWRPAKPWHRAAFLVRWPGEREWRVFASWAAVSATFGDRLVRFEPTICAAPADAEAEA